MPTLIEARKDEHEYVRCAAAGVLRKIGDKSAVPALIRALKDQKGDVREEATQALEKLGSY